MKWRHYQFEQVKKLRGNMLFKMVFLYCTFTFIIIYVLTSVLSQFAKSNLSDKIYISNLNKLSMMQVYCDTNVVQKINDIMVGMQMEVSGKTEIYNFMKTKSPLNEGALYNTYKELNAIIIETPIISSVELYNRPNNITLSSAGGIDYKPDSTQYKRYFYDERGPMWTEADNGGIAVISTFSLYIAPEGKNSCAIIRVNADELTKRLRGQLGAQEGIDFFIVDKNFQAVCGTNQDFADDISAFSFDAGKNIQDGMLGGVEAQLMHMDSALGDWKYVYLIPSSLYEQDISRLKTATSWNLAAMTLLCFFGLGCISLWLYRPIKQAVLSLRKHFKNEQDISDTRFINQQISRLITEVDEVNRTIGKNANLIRSQVVMETVYGNIEESEFRDRLQIIGEAFDTAYLVPVIVHINEELLSTVKLREQEYVLFRFCEILEEEYGRTYRCIAAKISYNCVCALVGCLTGEGIQQVTEAVADAFRKNGVTDFNIFLGMPQKQLEQVSRNCRSMTGMLKYAFLYGFGNILELEQLEASEQREGNISAAGYAERAEHFLSSGDILACKNMVDALYEECVKKDYSYAYTEGCFFALITAVTKFARSAVDKDTLKEVRVLSEEFSTLAGVRHYLDRLLEACGGTAHTDRAATETEFIEQVKQYILENIGADVSQNSVAADFNISTAHLSRTFKKVTGETFSDFVTGAKLDRAARLLLEEPGMTVAQAAEAVGYYNMNYFTTLFKKRFYKTPSQYRKDKK